MKRGMFASKPGTWPYYNEVYVYDLGVKKLLFKHALTGGYAAAFSRMVTMWRLLSLAVSKSFPFRN